VTFGVLILQFGCQDDRKVLTVDDYDDDQCTRYVCPCHKYGVKKRCDGVNMHHITANLGPCEEDGSSVWKWEFYSGRQHMSKRTWDIGVLKVIKRERNQAIALGNAEDTEVAESFEVLHSNCSVCQYRQDGVLVLFIIYIWFSVIWSLKWHYFIVSIYRYKFTCSNSCTSYTYTYQVTFPETSLAFRCTDWTPDPHTTCIPLLELKS